MRDRIILVTLALCCASSSGAQQPAGRVFGPRLSPLDPTIVAFERLDGDRVEIQFRNLRTGAPLATIGGAGGPAQGEVGLPEVAGRDLTSFTGDLDWRRSNDGRHWFCYVASDGRGLGLFVNSLDRSGRLPSTPPVRIPFSGNVRRPRWSPDGQHIAFVSDSGVLHVVWNAGNAVQARSAGSLRAVPLSQAAQPALFPAWAPRGDYIAYQIDKTIRGTRRFAVDIIPIDAAARTALSPITVTEALDENAYRPSWSPDGKYIAFYSSRSAQGGAEGAAMDIGVVELQVNPTSGRVFRGQVVQGRTRKLAENVVPNESRGPEWTKVSVGAQGRDAIAFVQLDQARNNPILFAGVQPWLEMRPRAEFETAPQAWNTVNHKDVSALEARGQVRYVYVSVAGGGENVQHRDAAAVWAAGPTIMTRDPAVVAAARRPSIGLGVAFPGGAQWSAGRTKKGLILTTTGIVGAIATFVGVTGTKSASDDAEDAISKHGVVDYERAASDHSSAWTLATLGAGAIAASWLLGLADAAMSRSSDNIQIDVRPRPAPGGAGYEARLGFRLPLVW